MVRLGLGRTGTDVTENRQHGESHDHEVERRATSHQCATRYPSPGESVNYCYCGYRYCGGYREAVVSGGVTVADLEAGPSVAHRQASPGPAACDSMDA